MDRFRVLPLVAGLIGALGGEAVAQAPVRFDQLPGYIGQWGCENTGSPTLEPCQGDSVPGDFWFPEPIAVDDSGSVYVYDQYERIQKFDSAGTFLLSWGVSGVTGIATGPANAIFVATRTTVDEYDEFGSWVRAVVDSGLVFASALAIAPTGEVVVGDGHIKIFDSAGAFVADAGDVGSGDGEFFDLRSVAISPTGDIFGLDAWHIGFGIERFSSGGAYLGGFAPAGFGPGELGQPSDIAFDEWGRLLVADRGNDRVQVLLQSGAHVVSWGGQGAGAGEFFRPGALCVAPNRRVYVADVLNSRVQEFGWVYTITTNPPGLTVKADGVAHTAPAHFDWSPSEQHTLATPKNQGNLDWKNVFDTWSDGGNRIHGVTVPDTLVAWSASFERSVRVTVEAGAGVSIETPTQWVVIGDSLDVIARSDDQIHEVEWTGFGEGSSSGPGQHAWVHPEEPIDQFAGQASYEVSGAELRVSGSATDPFESVGVASGSGLTELYLWITCARNGVAAIEAGVETGIGVLGFLPAAGVFNVGTPTNLVLAIGGCPTGPGVETLVGHWIVDDVAGEFCLGPTTQFSQWLVIVDCDEIGPGATRDPIVRGFSSSANPPCEHGVNGCVGAKRSDSDSSDGVVSDRVGLSVVPNPFSSSAEIRFDIQAQQHVSLHVYDARGRRVATLADRQALADGSVAWDGRDRAGVRVAPGVYFVRLTTEDTTRTAKVVVRR